MAEYIQHLCDAKKRAHQDKKVLNNVLAKWFLIQMMPKTDAPVRIMATTCDGYKVLAGDL
jgi:hypothetical protein